MDYSQSQSIKTNLYNRLFIMNPWFYNTDLNITQQAVLLHQLGVPRLSCSLGNDSKRWNAFPETLQALDNDKIELAAVYFVQEIDSGELPPDVEKTIQCLNGRDTLVWVALTSRKYKPSDLAGDSAAVQILQQAADAAQRADSPATRRYASHRNSTWANPPPGCLRPPAPATTAGNNSPAPKQNDSIFS